MKKPLVLYSRILRLHRTKLPPEMRFLGDAYVRDEFKKHKSANPQFLKQFFNEWEQYVTMFEQSKDQKSLGKDIDPSLVDMMTDEQKVQLHALKENARKN